MARLASRAPLADALAAVRIAPSCDITIRVVVLILLATRQLCEFMRQSVFNLPM